MTIETIVNVSPEGEGTLRLPPGVPPGQHRVVLTIHDEPPVNDEADDLDLPAYDVGPWPAGFTASREQIYDDGQ